MSINKLKREEIIAEILGLIDDSKGSFSAQEFAEQKGLSIQSIYRYLKELESEGKIKREKLGRNNVFSLVDEEMSMSFPLENLAEDVLWKTSVAPFFKTLPDIAKSNLAYAFTEIVNNAIDHSEGSQVTIHLSKNGCKAKVEIADDGIGIFTKIAESMKLEEKSFAVLELAKGKFTTAPSSHTGEGVFFSSKVVDEFAIISDDLAFYGPSSDNEPYLNKADSNVKGTKVIMAIKNNHTQTSKQVFDSFTQAPDDYGFSKTIVPVRLLEYGDAAPLVVSRSQAKRLMVRFEKFENIVLDFEGISDIGQGFADELFRVFPSQHKGTKLTPINCSDDIQCMIKRVSAAEE